MKTAIILHGMPDKEEYFDPDNPSQSNRHWFPWLQKQFALNNILAQTLEMPKPYEPIYEDWKEMFERMPIDSETTLVGHSLGAGFLVRWLSESDKKVGKVVLVAPWLDPTDIIKPFFDFEIDESISTKTESLSIFYSTNDFEDIQDSVTKLKGSLKNINWKEFENKGHFCTEDLGGPEFPELRDLLIN
ncbi:MAG: alpha/beta hydrolase [Candidatus Nomurabacteria bacterium]|nr:alpha/beta hydrolase [Candidatus Nomurabacteria bacterium]